MSKSRRVLLGVLVAAAGFAQTQGKPGRVVGSVTSAVTGAPMPNILVTLTPAGQGPAGKRYGARSSGDGSFSCDAIPPGKYILGAQAGNYLVEFGKHITGTFSVEAGGTVRGLEIKLMPRSTISGRVLDEKGDPVENVRVEVHARFAGFSMGDAITDDRGEFHIGGGFASGSILRAVPREFPFPAEIRSDGTQEVAYRSTYYPSAATVDAATPVETRPGVDTPGIDIHLLTMPILSVSGTVSGVPAGADNVWVYFDSEGELSGQQAEVRNGKFIIWRLPPGQYTVSSRCVGRDTRQFVSASQKIELTDRNLENLAFDLIPEFDLTGQIQWDGTPPAASSATPAVRLQPHDEPQIPGPPKIGKIAADQTFQIPKITVGRYDIKLDNMPQDAWVKSIFIDGHEAPDRFLDLRASPRNVTLLLAVARGQISGIVEDSKGPVSGVTVSLSIAGESGPPSGQQTGADGKYSFDGLAPGRYRVFVMQTISSGNLTFTGPVPSDSQNRDVIELSEGEKVTRNLKIE